MLSPAAQTGDWKTATQGTPGLWVARAAFQAQEPVSSPSSFWGPLPSRPHLCCQAHLHQTGHQALTEVALGGATQAAQAFGWIDPRQSGPSGPGVSHPVTAERTDPGYASPCVYTGLCFLNGCVPDAETLPVAGEIAKRMVCSWQHYPSHQTHPMATEEGIGKMSISHGTPGRH